MQLIIPQHYVCFVYADLYLLPIFKLFIAVTLVIFRKLGMISIVFYIFDPLPSNVPRTPDRDEVEVREIFPKIFYFRYVTDTVKNDLGLLI